MTSPSVTPACHAWRAKHREKVCERQRCDRRTPCKRSCHNDFVARRRAILRILPSSLDHSCVATLTSTALFDASTLQHCTRNSHGHSSYHRRDHDSAFYAVATLSVTLASQKVHYDSDIPVVDIDVEVHELPGLYQKVE
jgi:hypothetical protein